MTASPYPPIKAVVFDAYGTLFDVFCMEQLAEELFPSQGGALTKLWRQKQVEYTRIRSLCEKFVPFWNVTDDALVYAARFLHLDMSEAQRHRLMNQYACLQPFPEVRASLEAIKAMGLPRVILSNGTYSLLNIAVRYNALEDLFDSILSADQVQRFKTAPELYQLAEDALQIPAREMLFVSGNGWDACAATWFGYTSFWINRDDHPEEMLGVSPTTSGRSLADVVAYLQAGQTQAVCPA